MWICQMVGCDLSLMEFFHQLVSQWSGKYIDQLAVFCGVVSANDYPDLDFEALLKAADDRMYQRKRQ